LRAAARDAGKAPAAETVEGEIHLPLRDLAGAIRPVTPVSAPCPPTPEQATPNNAAPNNAVPPTAQCWAYCGRHQAALPEAYGQTVFDTVLCGYYIEESMGGTSLASPLVAAQLALVHQQQGQL
jgi:hypothetical protein